MRRLTILLALFACHTGASAQLTLPAVPRASLASSMLPSNTEVWLSINQELSSKTTRVGETFGLSVARDVMLGDHVVIPRGAPATGRISWRTGKGAFGKSAKMEFDLVSVFVAGNEVPIAGHYRIEGQGNTGATVGVAVAAGVFSAFVTGRSAVAAQGTEWKGHTREPIRLAYAGTGPAAGAAASAVGASNLSPYEAGRLAGLQAAAGLRK